MGYKSLTRSLMSVANKAAKEAERERRREAREAERLDKKMNSTYEKQEKVFNALKETYASGKIDEQRYKQLQRRKSDIGLELTVFGKSAGVSLGKRYLCGKINKKEFEKIKRELIPKKFFVETETVLKEINNIKEKISDFKNNCKTVPSDTCQKCDARKRFFNPIVIYDNLQLCKKCKKELENLKHYKGFSGEYITVAPVTIYPGIAVPTKINNEYL